MKIKLLSIDGETDVSTDEPVETCNNIFVPPPKRRAHVSLLNF